MSRVPIHTPDDAPEGAREPFARQAERVGRPLNIFGAMAHSPAVLNAYDQLERTIAAHTNLSPATREAIHLTVANVNACEYCQAAYTGSCKRNGFSVEDTLAIRRGALPTDAKLTALLQFAREIAAHRGHVSDEVWGATLAADWSDTELLDAYADVVRTVFTNWFNHLVGTELDLPAAPPLDTDDVATH